jgi:ribosomal protein S6
MVLLDNREVKKGWSQVKDAVAAMLTKHGAKVISSKLWGERRLCYPIRRNTRGTYLLVYFDSSTGAVNPIRRELELAEFVLRHLVTVCEEVPSVAHEPDVAFDVSTIKEEELAPLPVVEREEVEVAEAAEPEAKAPAEAGSEADAEGAPAAGEEKAGKRPRAEKPPRGETADKAAKAEKGERGEKSAKPDKSDKGEKPAKVEKPEKGEKAGKPARAEKPEKAAEKADKPERAAGDKKAPRKEKE